MSTQIQRMDIAEFRSIGWLQELNRRLLHPAGLALEVTTVEDSGWDPSGGHPLAERLAEAGYDAAGIKATLDALYPPGSSFLSGVWDYRDDPEGVYFGGEYLGDLKVKADRVEAVLRERAPARERALGYVVQPATEREARP
jgi:hypothetical protein